MSSFLIVAGSIGGIALVVIVGSRLLDQFKEKESMRTDVTFFTILVALLICVIVAAIHIPGAFTEAAKFMDIP
ncbi:MAG: hypothetical protein K6D97_03205 [Clostridia bacterium]|nr:hypothetical protein [Clostridia bacterium]